MTGRLPRRPGFPRGRRDRGAAKAATSEQAPGGVGNGGSGRHRFHLSNLTIQYEMSSHVLEGGARRRAGKERSGTASGIIRDTTKASSIPVDLDFIFVSGSRTNRGGARGARREAGS